jgi:hypothetical protein
MIWPRRESSASRAGPVRKDLHLSAVLIIPPLGPSKPPQDSPAACLGQGFGGVHSLFHTRRAANSMTAVGQDLHRWTGSSSRRQPPGRRWRADDRWLLRPLDHYRIGWVVAGVRQARWFRLGSQGPLVGFLAAVASPPVLRPKLVQCSPAFSRGCTTRVARPAPCLSSCWCHRTRFGEAFRWYVPARFHRFRIPSDNSAVRDRPSQRGRRPLFVCTGVRPRPLRWLLRFSVGKPSE